MKQILYVVRSMSAIQAKLADIEPIYCGEDVIGYKIEIKGKKRAELMIIPGGKKDEDSEPD